MSAITGLQGGSSSLYAALSQQLFKSIDQNGDGSIGKSDLEQAVTTNGGTAQTADQLYAALDPNAAGSVDAQQFSSGLQSLFTSQTQGALIQAQSDATGAPAGTAPPHGGHHGHRLQQLFDTIDSNGDGAVNQSELEQAFSSQGLPTGEADQLFAALDPTGTGSIDEQQFASGMRALSHQTDGTQSPAAGEQNIEISVQVSESGSADPGSAAGQTLSDLLKQVESILSGTASSGGSAASGGTDKAAASGSAGGSDATTTQITYNADGTVTTTVTNPDGTESVTTTGTPSNGTSGSGAGGSASLDQILKDVFSLGSKLSSGALSSGTLGQLLTQQQAG